MMTTQATLPKSSIWGRSSPINEDKIESDDEITTLLNMVKVAKTDMTSAEAIDYFGMMLKKKLNIYCDDLDRCVVKMAKMYLNRRKFICEKVAEANVTDELDVLEITVDARETFDKKWADEQIQEKQAQLREIEIEKRKSQVKEFTKATHGFKYFSKKSSSQEIEKKLPKDAGEYLEKLKQVNDKMKRYYEGRPEGDLDIMQWAEHSCKDCAALVGKSNLKVCVPVTVVPNQLVADSSKKVSEGFKIPSDVEGMKIFVKTGTPIWGPHATELHPEFCMTCSSNVPSLKTHYEMNEKCNPNTLMITCKTCGEYVPIKEHLRNFPECRIDINTTFE